MRPSRRLLASAALVAVTALFAGCGGDDEDDEPTAGTTTPAQTTTAPAPTATQTTTSTTPAPTPVDPGEAATGADRREIEAVVRASLTTSDPERSCSAITTRLRARVYETQARCLRIERKKEKEEGKDDPEVDKVVFSSVTVQDGRKGIARLTATGDGITATGAVSVLRERGKWLVHGYEADLLRSVIVSVLESDDDEDTAAFLKRPEAIACVRKDLAESPDARVQNLYYDSSGERNGGDKRFVRLVLDCAAADPEGRALVRKQFEQGILESDRRTRALSQCVVQRLRMTASDDLVVGVVLDDASGKENTPQARRLNRLAGQAIQACAAQPGTDNSTS